MEEKELKPVSGDKHSRDAESSSMVRSGEDTTAAVQPPLKRSRSTVHSVKVSQDIGAYFTPQQSFRELLANAFDNHVEKGLNPADVKITPAPGYVPADQDGITFSVHSRGAPISIEAFKISLSRKREFRMGSKGLVSEESWRSLIGCFGCGMTSAHAHLVERKLSIVYETDTMVVVVISTQCGENQHEQQCISATRKAGVHIDEQQPGTEVSLDIPSFAAGAAAAAAGVASDNISAAQAEQALLRSHLDKLHVRKFHREAAVPPLEGTKVHINLPEDASERAHMVEAWVHALQSFV